jgi:hypothetical protein
MHTYKFREREREREKETDELTNIIEGKHLKKNTTKSYLEEFPDSFIVLMCRQT